MDLKTNLNIHDNFASYLGRNACIRKHTH